MGIAAALEAETAVTLLVPMAAAIGEAVREVVAERAAAKARLERGRAEGEEGQPAHRRAGAAAS